MDRVATDGRWWASEFHAGQLGRALKERLGGVAGCTHLTRLAQELAVVALQTIMPLRSRDEAVTEGAQRKPAHLDGCHALATDGPIVREIAPRWYRGKP